MSVRWCFHEVVDSVLGDLFYNLFYKKKKDVSMLILARKARNGFTDD